MNVLLLLLVCAALAGKKCDQELNEAVLYGFATAPTLESDLQPPQAGATNVALHEDPFLQSMVQFADDAGTVPAKQEHNLHHIMQMLHDQQLQTIMHLHSQFTQQIGHVMNQQQQLIQQSI
ncbi:hypothetical protein AK812_SmicGene22551 [Symbiodinium microadriaticum]|uniref:Uncharacterized protein n=1 Tax=Symbiodinium microadriaticum TaxID=2951 RepID=A0A1Q9DJI7_SYMMI|nr:hypothetical protein AK812_SmicGene22551 [Symbiodinium microadriaticum]